MVVFKGASVLSNVTILLKKPVILFKNSLIPKLSRLSDKEVIIECSKIDDLESIIKNSISHPISNDAFEHYISKQIGNFDGKNSVRISEIILKLIQDINLK